MENAVKIQLPVSVSYPALESLLKKQLVGEYIPKPEENTNEPPYAQILDVAITGSSAASFNISLRIKLRILRTVLKRDQVDLLVLASLDYDNAAQRLYVRTFRLEARTPSAFYNKALEVLANKVAYNQILKKTRFNLREILSKEINKANGLLESGLELKGLHLTGRVEKVLVQDISPQAEGVSLLLELQANAKADIFDILSLMPPK